MDEATTRFYLAAARLHLRLNEAKQAALLTDIGSTHLQALLQADIPNHRLGDEEYAQKMALLVLGEDRSMPLAWDEQLYRKLWNELKNITLITYSGLETTIEETYRKGMDPEQVLAWQILEGINDNGFWQGLWDAHFEGNQPEID